MELINNFTARQEYEEKLLRQFWVAMKDSYPKTTKKALRILVSLSRPICASLDFLLCCKLKASKEIDLTLKMIYDVHSQTALRIRMLSDRKQGQV